MKAAEGSESAEPMKKRTVAYILHGLGANGIDTFIYNVVKNIDRTKFEPTLVLAVDSDNTQFYEPQLVSMGIRIIKLCDLDGVRKKLAYFKALYRLFRQSRFDLVHANMDMLNGIILLLARRAGIRRRISHSHVTGSQYTGTGGKKFVSLVYHRTMRALIRLCATDRIGCSREANFYLYRNAPAQVVNNGILLERFQNLEIDTTAYRAENGMQAKYQLVTVGRIERVKNPIFLLGVVRELAGMRDDFCLNWVGTGSMFEEIRREIAACQLESYVHLLGNRSDIPEILSCCDLFLLPSLAEGLGIVLVEAQASRVLCIASTGVPEAVDCGLCRFLPVDGEPKVWADEIHSCLESGFDAAADPQKLDAFSIHRTVKSLQDLYMGESRNGKDLGDRTGL